MTDMTDNDETWRRLGRLIDARLDRLAVDPLEVEHAGGPKATKLREIRNGRARTLRKSLRPGLENVLRWTPGDIERVLRGDEPTPLPDDVDDRRLDSIDVTAGGAEGLRNHMRRSTIMKKAEADRTAEERKFVEDFDDAHPRRPDPALGVDDDGNWLPVEVTFDNWVRARYQLNARVLHYARARGIAFQAAEEELPHVQQMAADVANGTGRPWTPPWDPGTEFEEDEEPWKAEFWSYAEAVPSPFGTGGHIYQHGTTYDLAQVRRNRELSVHADEVWEEDVRQQTAAYQQARGDAKPPTSVLDGSFQLSRVTSESAETTTDIPSNADDLTRNDEPPSTEDLDQAARTAPPGYRPGQSDQGEAGGEERQDVNEGGADG